MVVALEVFQLDMFALKFGKCWAWKSRLMSVTFETSQLAMSVMSPLSASLSSSLFAKELAPISTGIHHNA